MQLSNDASNTYNVLPLMRDLPKAKVFATEVEISGQDTAAELAALKATAKAQDAKTKALSAQLRGDTSGAKRARNGKHIPVALFKTYDKV